MGAREELQAAAPACLTGRPAEDALPIIVGWTCWKTWDSAGALELQPDEWLVAEYFNVS